MQAGPEDTYTVLHAAAAAAGGPQVPTASEGLMAEAPGAGSGGSVAVAAANRRAGQDHSMVAEDQMLMQMSGLTVGAAAAAAAGAAKAHGGKADASVYAAAMHAGEKAALCRAWLSLFHSPSPGGCGNQS